MVDQRVKPTGQKVNDLEEHVSLLALESKELQRQIHKLQLHKDMLVETLKIIKKDEVGNPKNLSNYEKTIMIDLLRKTFKLKGLLEIFDLSKRRYFHQRTS